MGVPSSEHLAYHFESYSYKKYGRFWAVYDGAGQMICVAVYRKGAKEVVRRLSPDPGNWPEERRLGEPGIGET